MGSISADFNPRDFVFSVVSTWMELTQRDVDTSGLATRCYFRLRPHSVKSDHVDLLNRAYFNWLNKQKEDIA